MDIIPKGQEPANIKAKMDSLFAKLDGAYPDRNVVGLHNDHKKWGETVTALYRVLGYPDGKTFLEAYGYSYGTKEPAGGRPKTTDPMAIIQALQSKYPNGSPFCSVDALFADNPAYLPKLKTLKNLSGTVFGMPLSKYLLSIGLIQKKSAGKVPAPKPKKPETYCVCTVQLPNGKDEMQFLSNTKSIHSGDYVAFPIWSDLNVYGVVTDTALYTEADAPDDLAQMPSIAGKSSSRECQTTLQRNIIAAALSRHVAAFLETAHHTPFHPAELPPADPSGYIPWACCRGLSVEIFRVLDYLVTKEPLAYQHQDIILLSEVVAELHVYAPDVEDVLLRFPNIKMAMFMENRETGQAALGYSRSGYAYLTDTYEIGSCGTSKDPWSLKHSPAQSGFIVCGRSHPFVFSEDWEEMNDVYIDRSGTAVKLGTGGES